MDAALLLQSAVKIVSLNQDTTSLQTKTRLESKGRLTSTHDIPGRPNQVRYAAPGLPTIRIKAEIRPIGIAAANL